MKRLAVLVAAGLLIPAAVAEAHVELESVSPRKNSTRGAVREVHATFKSSLTTGLITIKTSSGAGRPAAQQRAQARQQAGPPGDPALGAALRQLPRRVARPCPGRPPPERHLELPRATLARMRTAAPWIVLGAASAAAAAALGAAGLPSPTLFAALLIGLAAALIRPRSGTEAAELVVRGRPGRVRRHARRLPRVRRAGGHRGLVAAGRARERGDARPEHRGGLGAGPHDARSTRRRPRSG